MAKNQKTEPAIEICHLKKSFIIPKYNNNSLKQIIVNGWKRNEKQVHKVLDDISFTINKGDFFGIVGRNGSGKSTLLKTICGVYSPDEGEIKLHGNLTPFIELGVGFNPELSGRDNVYLNGALLGFSRQQMNQMYDEIVEFAELEEFMDLKLKNYSSGMQVRLAFSIAIKAKNDILIFDEVLAVGDEAFQRKCLNVFEEYKKNGQTVILVTHDMGSVSKFCNKAMMLSDGKIEAIGKPEKIANIYKKLNNAQTNDNAKKRKQKSTPVTLTGLKEVYNFGDKMRIAVHYPADLDVDKIGVAIIGSGGEYMFGSNCAGIKNSSNAVEYEVLLNLGPGQYFLDVALYDKKGGVSEYILKMASFLIYDDFNAKVGGLTRFDYCYYVNKKPKK